jgi:esterase
MNLNYKVFGESGSHRPPLIILHGLLGSLDNWQTIARKLSDKLQVFIIDQRNHGRSPHTSEFNYELLSNDLLEFYQQHNISKAHLLGHSMGGKTAMQFALQHSDKVEQLIVVDVAPVAYEDQHSNVFAALLAADVKNAKAREEVEASLREKIKDEATVQFLMKGLQREEAPQSGFQWRLNVESLHKNYGLIAAGITSSKSFAGETLFIKGEKSSYINPDHYPAIEKLFPNYQVSEINEAGHWVHADKPNEFISEVIKFLI